MNQAAFLLAHGPSNLACLDIHLEDVLIATINPWNQHTTKFICRFHLSGIINLHSAMAELIEGGDN